jgi:UDP:flavonoid glycosyltransferase YjiC (YdhE family)
MEGMKLVEVVIANAATLPLLHAVAEYQQKPVAITYFMPPVVPTRYFPVPDLAFMNWGPYNLLTYWLVRFSYWRIVKEDVQTTRKQLGLKPLKENLIHYIDRKKPLDLYCFSPSLLPAPPDWEPHHQVTGFMRLPFNVSVSGLAEQEEHRLMRWLENGTPPIYIGFGSNGIGKRIPLSTLLRIILDKTNERIVFCTGWSGLENLPDDPRLFVVKEVNHDFLLPRCKAGIFHGGAGTLCSMIHHRLPMIILSMYTDQPFWGKLVEARGMGVHLPLRQWTTSKLLHALEQVLQPEYAAQVKIVADPIVAEYGTLRAAQLIEAYFAGDSFPSR